MKNNKYKIRRDFVKQQFGNKLVIYDVTTSVIYELNETAAFIFRKIQAGKVEAEIVNSFSKKFLLKKEKAEKDVESCLKYLIEQKIINPSSK